jgi:holo-[acyl-carrier protein] synthase
MIIGVGVDLVDVVRFSKALTKSPKLKERIFGKSDSSLSAQSLAARFAAKEALIKALGSASGLALNELTILQDSEGKPYFAPLGQSRVTIEQAGVHSLHLSMSHDGNMATAFVVAEGTP